MTKFGWKQVWLPLALVLVGGGAHAGQEDASELQAAKRSTYRIGVKVSAKPGSPSKSQATVSVAPIFKFSRIPRTLRLVSKNTDTQLATGSSQTFGSSVDVNTNGRSTCVRVTAQDRASKSQIVLSYAVMAQTDKIDPRGRAEEFGCVASAGARIVASPTARAGARNFDAAEHERARRRARRPGGAGGAQRPKAASTARWGRARSLNPNSALASSRFDLIRPGFEMRS